MRGSNAAVVISIASLATSLVALYGFFVRSPGGPDVDVTRTRQFDTAWTVSHQESDSIERVLALENDMAELRRWLGEVSSKTGARVEPTPEVKRRRWRSGPPAGRAASRWQTELTTAGIPRIRGANGVGQDEIDRLNRALETSFLEYIGTEQQHGEVTKEDDGVVHVVISPFPEAGKSIKDRLVSHVDEILRAMQDAGARDLLIQAVDSYFSYFGVGTTYLTIREEENGFSYEWRYCSPDETHGEAQTGRSAELPERFRRYWW